MDAADELAAKLLPCNDDCLICGSKHDEIYSAVAATLRERDEEIETHGGKVVPMLHEMRERIAALEADRDALATENAELRRKLEAANCPVGWGEQLR